MMHYVFDNKLNVEPSECEGVVLTTFDFTDAKIKEEMVRIMFEVFEV